MKINFDTLFASGAQAEQNLRAAFTWLTRIGAAPAFGSRPIGWYQQHQCHAIDALRALVGNGEHTLRCKGGRIEVWQPLPGSKRAWFVVTPAQAIFDTADRLCRNS